jgi:hypothetical protein
MTITPLVVMFSEIIDTFNTFSRERMAFGYGLISVLAFVYGPFVMRLGYWGYTMRIDVKDNASGYNCSLHFCMDIFEMALAYLICIWAVI